MQIDASNNKFYKWWINYLEVSRTARTCFNQPDASSEFKNPPIVNDFWSMEIARIDEEQ